MTRDMSQTWDCAVIVWASTQCHRQQTQRTMRRSVQGCWPGHYTRLNTTRILSDKLYLHGVERINSFKYRCSKTDPRCQEFDIHLSCQKSSDVSIQASSRIKVGFYRGEKSRESPKWAASPWEVSDLRRQEMVTIKTSSAVSSITHRQTPTKVSGDKPQIVKI